MRLRYTTTRSAFTLTELMVTLAIIVILLAITFPSLGLLVSTNRVGAAIDTIQVGITASRAYATQQKADLDTIDFNFSGATYSGTAILITPAGEMRLVENEQSAIAQNGDSLEKNGRDGFADIADRDYIVLPDGAGVVGIIRVNGALHLLPPPFAIRYDRHGHLVVGTDAASLVHYDANFSSFYQLAKTRTNPHHKEFPTDDYDPTLWDGESPLYTQEAENSANSKPGIHPDSKRQKLPFEVIETVVGLLVYDKYEFNKSLDMPGEIILPDTGPGSNVNVGQWLQDNGQTLFINRYSGTIIDR